MVRAHAFRMYLSLLFLASSVFAADAHWPRWRGPEGNSHAAGSDTPTRWDPTSVLWKSELPGSGQSSPTVWGDRIFLTSALENGKQRVVFCVDSREGKIVWKHIAWTGEPEKSHNMNGWASATCSTDGEVVIAFFGKGGLHAYTVEGKHLWSKDLGTFESPWGTAACPILVGNLVIQNGDSDRDAFIEAFDRKSGQSVWWKKRPDNRGWSTPVLIKRDAKQELVLNGHTGVTAYDPATGDELWFSKNSNGRGEPSVTLGGGLLYVVCGLAGDMYAVRPPATGAKTPETIWSAARRSGRDLPSPVVVGNYVLVGSLNGIVSCYDANTGHKHWQERLTGQFSSSPIAVGGLVLHQNEAGETSVIEPGPTLNVVRVNKLDAASEELFRASLTPVSDRIYSRSNRFLYCIGSAKAATAQ